MAKLQIENIRDAGILDKERVVIRVKEDCDLGDYLLLRTTASSDSLHGGPVIAFWFEDIKVKAGDLVILYSKNGSKKTKETKAVTSYFFYWKKTTALWSSSALGAAIGEFATWTSFKIGGFQTDEDCE